MLWLDHARSSFQTIFQHHFNELARIDRAATAKAWGLDPCQFATPYTQQAIVNNNQRSSILPMLLGAALGIGTMGAGAWIGKLLSAAPQAIKQTETVTQEFDSSVDMIVEPPQ